MPRSQLLGILPFKGRIEIITELCYVLSVIINQSFLFEKGYLMNNEVNTNDIDEMDEPYIIELTGDDGETLQFELADSFEYEGKVYAVLLSLDETDEQSVFLEVTPDPEDDECEIYNSVTDEALLDTLFQIFKERNADNFNFVD